MKDTKQRDLRGYLQLRKNQTKGTIAILHPDTKTVIASTWVDERGRFFIKDIALIHGKIIGFPGVELEDKELEKLIEHPVGIYYEALFSEHRHETIYINGISTLTSNHNSQLTAKNDTLFTNQLKDHLFGKHASIFFPGYSPEFIAHIAQSSLFDVDIFLKEIEGVDNIQNMLKKLTDEIDSTVFTSPRFASSQENNTSRPGTFDAGIPTIPASANWAVAHKNWTNTLSAVNKTCLQSAKGMAENSDGLAASVKTFIDGFTISTIGSWAFKQISGPLSSYISSQVLGLVSEWLFGKPSNPILDALAKVTEQLNEIIANQMTQLHILSAIMDELKKIKKDAILIALAAPLSTIQSNVQTVYGFINTPGKGIPPAVMEEAIRNILNANNGVTWAIQYIHNLIMGGSGATSLVQASLECNLKPLGINGLNQNFLSNQNCYLNGQSLFQYYTNIQIQGVQLIMQAYNYLQNKDIDDINIKLTPSPNAEAFYDKWMIGGKGYHDGTKSNLEQQRDYYRKVYQPYYEDFQHLLGQMPDDVAVCLIPEVENQVAPFYYNTESKVLVLGLISYTLRNWTDDLNILEKQKTITTSQSWLLPEALKPLLQYPSKDQLKELLGSGFSSPYYHGNYYSYLRDQGLRNDFEQYPIKGVDNYAADVLIWTTETTLVDSNNSPWGWNNQGGDGPSKNVYPPIQTNGNECALKYRNPRYQWWYEGKVPKAYRLENNGKEGELKELICSANAYDPHTDASWVPIPRYTWLSYNRVNGGLLLIKLKK